jgi:hypothetical protein
MSNAVSNTTAEYFTLKYLTAQQMCSDKQGTVLVIVQ